MDSDGERNFRRGEMTYNREVSSLINASTLLNCDKLSLIAFTNTRDVELDGKLIHIVSATEWLLGI